MATVKTKLIVAAIVLAAATCYLASAGIKSGWVYYVDVDKFVADPQYKTQRVRLHGKVATEGCTVSSAALSASFKLQGKTASIPVVYHGSIPDMFQTGRDVVVEGKVDGSGKFAADVLMTKCASKYEAKSPHGKDGPKS